MVAGVSQGLAGVGREGCGSVQREEKLRGEEQEASGSPNSGMRYTFEFRKGTVIASRLLEEVEIASVSHTLGCWRDWEKRGQRSGWPWAGGSVLCPADQLLFPTGRAT